MSEANHNPLIAPLLVLLQQTAGSYKVHELMAALRQQGRSLGWPTMSNCSCFGSTS